MISLFAVLAVLVSHQQATADVQKPDRVLPAVPAEDEDPFDVSKIEICSKKHPISFTTNMEEKGKWLEIESVNTGEDVEILVNPWDGSQMILEVDIGQFYAYESYEEARMSSAGRGRTYATEAVGMIGPISFHGLDEHMKGKSWFLWKSGAKISKRINIEQAMLNPDRWEHENREHQVIKGWDEPIRFTRVKPVFGEKRTISAISFIVDKRCPKFLNLTQGIKMDITFPKLK